MTACTTKAVSEKETAANNTGNYSDEMKIEDNEDLDPEAGSDSVVRAGDHKQSPYFTSLDYYNMTSSGSLSILPKFKTIQQSSEWSCGVASALMVMDFYGKRGNLGEEDIAKLRSNGLTPGPTSVKQAVEMFGVLVDILLNQTMIMLVKIHMKYSLCHVSTKKSKQETL